MRPCCARCWAALLAWLYRNDALSARTLTDLGRGGWEDALGFAVSAAAVTVSRPGAEPPYLPEVPVPW